MKITTKNFGEVVIDDDKIITFPGGIVGFPDLKSFTLIHNEEKDKVNSVHWLQTLDEPAFAMPVLDPLLVEENYNPEVEHELLKPLGELNAGACDSDCAQGCEGDECQSPCPDCHQFGKPACLPDHS